MDECSNDWAGDEESILRLCFLPAVRAANGTNDASFVTGRWSDHSDLSVCLQRIRGMGSASANKSPGSGDSDQ